MAITEIHGKMLPCCLQVQLLNVACEDLQGTLLCSIQENWENESGERGELLDILECRHWLGASTLV